MKKLEEFERTVGDRMQMQQYQQGLTASGIPLEETQRTQLLNIMKEERLKLPRSPFEASNKDPGEQFKALRSPDAVADLLKHANDFNEKVRDRARTILTPEQLNAFQSAQDQQQEMMKMGMKMSQQMFGGGANKNSGATPPPPVPVEKK
jgi:Spy/CpxP family protein refolding chaperone